LASNLTQRIVFAVLAIPAVLGIAWLGGWAFVALLGVAAALGAREVYALARAHGAEPLERSGMALAFMVPFVVAVPVLLPGLFADLVRDLNLPAAGLMSVMLVALARRGPGARPLSSVAVTVFGVLYAGWLLSFAIHLRHPGPRVFANDAAVGLPLLVYPLALTWLGDTAAMIGGRVFGGAKLAPVVSPNKTWSGALSGMFVTTAVSVIYAATVLARAGVSMSVTEAVLAGVVISAAGQAGDVAESLLKREAGVKDSSSLIPGHGGVLDRLDALYFVLPATVMLFGIMQLI
jgi:phosphatidate cytidylyltransferase